VHVLVKIKLSQKTLIFSNTAVRSSDLALLQNAKDEVKSDKRNAIFVTRDRQSVSMSQGKNITRRENTESHRVSQFNTEQSPTAGDNISCTEIYVTSPNSMVRNFDVMSKTRTYRVNSDMTLNISAQVHSYSFKMYA
jgi:hypothetical protein